MLKEKITRNNTSISYNNNNDNNNVNNKNKKNKEKKKKKKKKKDVRKSCRDPPTCFIGVFLLSSIKVLEPTQCRVENTFLRNM